MVKVKSNPEAVNHGAEESWPDELALLLGPNARGLLSAIADAAGGTLGAWRPRQVNHQPNRSTMVQYRASVLWPTGATTPETFVVATGDRMPAKGAAVFGDGSTQVAVWRWPHDPFLPGLAAALDPQKVGSLLDDLGIDGGSVQLRTRAYRPGRRAVIEATGRRGRLFLKVVQPEKAEALHQRHRSLAPHLPVPESVGWTSQGAVVLQARPGLTLRESLRSSNRPIPTPAEITALLDRLPGALAAESPRRDLLSSAVHNAGVIAATVSGMDGRLDDLLEALSGESGEGPLTAVHGDLYESQLLVDRGRITGLLDIDTAGAGLRVDDLANFCAHLSVVALVSDRPRQIKRFGAALLAHAEGDHDPADLRRRIAAAVVGLATGPFRVLETHWAANTARRLDLARDWLASAKS